MNWAHVSFAVLFLTSFLIENWQSE